MNTEQNRWVSDKYCTSLINKLFPNGLTGDDVLKELIPEGFENSSFVLCKHPTDKIFYRTQKKLRKILYGISPTNTTAEIPLNTTKPIDIKAEMAKIIGDCLWDVFSGNNDVYARNGSVYHIGSWRGTARFIANFIQANDNLQQFKYSNFYMGSMAYVEYPEEVALEKVYKFIFEKLKANNLRWRIDYDVNRPHGSFFLRLKTYYEVFGVYPKNTTPEIIRKANLYYLLTGRKNKNME